MAKAVKSVVKGVVNVVKGVVKAIGSVVTGVVKAVGKVVTSVVNFVASPFMNALGIPDATTKTTEETRQQGVLVQTQGSYVDLPVVYGYRKIAGTVVYAETGAEENKYLWVAYALCEGTVEGLRELTIDDVQMPADTAGKLNAGQIVDITDSTSKYAGRVRLQFFPGVFQTNPVNTQVAALSILKDSPSWKNTNHFNGVAVLFARYEWKKIVTQTDSDNNPFSGNIPLIQVGMMGRRVANIFASGIENIEYGASGYTERYSYNPVECLLDYLRNPRYGKGLTNSEIDWSSFKTSAIKTSTQVNYILGTSGPILTLNYVLDTSQTIFNNVKHLLTHMRGYLPYVQGKYKLKIEDAGNETSIISGSANIVAAFTNDGRTSTSWSTGTRNIMGDITYTGIDRSSKYNSVVVSYVDPDQKWSVQQVIYPETETERQTYITADGGRENKGEFTFGGITNYAIAKDFAKLIFNKSRWQDSCSFTGDSSCFDLEPGDNIYIDSKILRFGLEPSASAIPWRIVSIKLNNDYTFELGCVRNPDFLYPHTSVGAIDTVVPTYVPKGASIYYPDPKRTPPVGLVPPNSAPYTPVSGTGGSTGNNNTGGSTDGNTGGNTTTNPPTVIVIGGTGTGGGTNGTAGTAVAIGSISQTNLTVTSVTSGIITAGMFVNGTGVISNTKVLYQVNGTTGGAGGYQVDKTQTVAVGTTLNFSLVASTNNTPATPPVVPPLTNTINITRLSFQLENGSVYAIMEFNQPNHVMYAGTLFYYKSTLDSYYRTYENTDIPGPNAKISVKLGPLVNNSRIELVTRVKYSTGEFSTTIAKTAFNASATDPASDPVEYTEVVASGWALPTDIPANSRDTVMNNTITDTVSTGSRTILNSGVPYSPRRMRITTKQNVISNGLLKYNYYIKGFNIYYKQSDQTVWRTAYYNFATGYAEGSTVDMNSWQTTPPMNLGVAFNTTTTPSDPGRRQKYDMILRYSYTDGTESTYQFRKMLVNTEVDTGLLDFNPFYGGSTNFYNELVSDYVNAYGFITDVTAGPGFITDPLNITVGVNSIFANTTTLYGNSLGSSIPHIVINIDPPVVSNQPDWTGVRLIKRKFGGTDVTTDFTGLIANPVTGLWQIKTPVDYTGTVGSWASAAYEYVIIPLVYTTTGGTTPQEANTAFYFGGSINTQDPTLGASKNWLSTLAPVSYTPSVARSKLGTISNTIIKDVGITAITGTVYAPGGTIQDPRELEFTITQSATDSYTASSITGVKMYYRPMGNQYYSYAAKTITLTPGTASASFRSSTMTTAPEFGSPSSQPVIYDIIFRIVFSDGTESTKELRTQANLTTTGVTGFAQYATNNTNILTIDQAPPGSETDPRDFNFTLRQVFFTSSTGNIRANIQSITQSFVSGVKIRYREIVIGSNPAYQTWSDDTIRVDQYNQTYLSVGQGTFQNNREYEVVITPLVRYNNVRQEATTSWYGRGLVTANTSLLDAMRFYQVNTNVALDKLVTTLAQDAGATTILVAYNGWKALSVPSGNYAQLKFTKSHITGYYGVDIYRREFRPTVGSIYTEYAGLGRWEKCATVTDATHAPDANGIVTVNMRMPISANELNFYYQMTGQRSPQLMFDVPYNSLPLMNVPGTNVTTTGPQYLAVVRTSGGATESTRCMVLPLLGAIGVEYYTPLMNTDTTGTYIRNVAEFNSTTVAKLRNLSQAPAEFTATISGTTMTVSAVASGTLQVGQWIRNAADTLKADPITTKPLAVFITAFVSGSGSTGTYTVSQSITLASATTIYAEGGSRATPPLNHIVRTGNYFSNAYNAAYGTYVLPITSPVCI